MKAFVGEVLEGILERIAHATKRERALAMELAQVKDQLGIAAATADERLALLTASAALADERAALLAASSALAEERAALLAAAATRAESAEKQLDIEHRQRALTEKRMVRLELQVQAHKRRRERLQAELCKSRDQLAQADVSGRIRELQEAKAQLQQRLADLQTYSEEKQGSATPP